MDLAALSEYVDEYLRALAAAWLGSSAGQLAALIGEVADAPAAVEAVRVRVEWEEKRAEKTGRTARPMRASTAGSVATYALLGVGASIWMARGRLCPDCRSLSGNAWPRGRALRKAR